MLHGRLIGRIGPGNGIRQAMLVNETRCGLGRPLSAQNTRQQRAEDKRIRNNAADKAAP
jgi:hypothetical protein